METLAICVFMLAVIWTLLAILEVLSRIARAIEIRNGR